MLNDRNNIKWAPFNAVINGDEAIEEIIKKKNKIIKPILSQDQIEELEYKIIDNYNSKRYIYIKYFNNNSFHITEGIIEKIDLTTKKIILNSKISLFFTNIIEIYEKNT